MRRLDSPRGEVLVCGDLGEISREAARFFCDLAQQSVQRSGRFAVALAGGSTPKTLYGLLAEQGFRERVDWNRVHLFWADERCVPPSHADSNYGMVRDALLSRVEIPDANVFRMRGEDPPDAAAAEYESVLRGQFHLGAAEWPRFELVLLGLGDDGHTASLFPGSAATTVVDRLVVATYVEKIDAHRLTMTFPVINRASNVVFLVSGKSKANALKGVLAAKGDDFEFPARRVNPGDGRLLWIADEDAAAGIMR
jgi:6-phosphogluconolactonase